MTDTTGAQSTRPYWLHTLSPTHVGTGRGLGYIDLPLQREKITQWPYIPGSAVKGVIADHHRATDEKRKNITELGVAFGKASDANNDSSNAGALIFTDALLVCLPVRSFYGTFAWCTAPLVLQRLARDLNWAGLAPPDAQITSESGHAWLPPKDNDIDSVLIVANENTQGSEAKIFLEDLDLICKRQELAGQWAQYIAEQVFPNDKDWQEAFKKRFVILPDEIFNFLSQTGTEVRTRVKINAETKTVAYSQLWTEESLPAESILAGLVCCDRVFSTPNQKAIKPEKLLSEYVDNSLTLQIGGKASIGLGRVQCVFSKGAASS